MITIDELKALADAVSKKGDSYRDLGTQEALVKSIACYEIVADIYKRIFEIQKQN